jgi:hypothetical protein
VRDSPLRNLGGDDEPLAQLPVGEAAEDRKEVSGQGRGEGVIDSDVRGELLVDDPIVFSQVNHSEGTPSDRAKDPPTVLSPRQHHAPAGRTHEHSVGTVRTVEFYDLDSGEVIWDALSPDLKKRAQNPNFVLQLGRGATEHRIDVSVESIGGIKAPATERPFSAPHPVPSSPRGT